MSETQDPDRTRELGELFVSVTGDETVTESQEGDGEKRAAEGDEEFESPEDGLGDAIDADLDASTN
jgi:hypothetical protein